MFRKLTLAAAAAAFALAAGQAAASTVVFSDDFDDNDVSDWDFTTNHPSGAGIDTGGILGPYIQPGDGGTDLFARATKTLNLLAGDYEIDFDVSSVVCDGCVISYDLLLDGGLLFREATFGATVARNFDLGALTAGAHTLTLGMHTTAASSGHFLATFDNVVLTGDNLVIPTSPDAIPEPSTWAMMILGFFGAGAILRRRGSGGLPARMMTLA